VSAGHDHAKGLTATGRYRGRLTVVMAISAGIAAAEIAGALVSGSLVLLADAAHMAADAAGVGLSVLAAYVATRPATDRRTFGYARAEILAATVNALLLLGLAAFIIVEAVQRLAAPPSVGSGLMIVFGVVALAGNGVSLLLLRRGQAQSLNVRGAFLEVASDTFGALAVIVSGIVSKRTMMRFVGVTVSDMSAISLNGLSWLWNRGTADGCACRMPGQTGVSLIARCGNAMVRYAICVELKCRLSHVHEGSTTPAAPRLSTCYRYIRVGYTFGRTWH
jgi:cobalt-zinc-cadmium efflux system protein